MSGHGESSKNAEKRAKQVRRATVAASRQQENRGIRISGEALNSPADSGANSHSQPHVEKTKRKRGPAKMKMVCTNNDDMRYELKFNDRGQVVGPHSSEFASFLGCVARSHVPIVITDWGKVDATLRNDIWEHVQQHYKVDECHKSLTLQMVGRCWRYFKSTITSQILEAVKSGERPHHLSYIKPPNLKSDQEWDAFVKDRLSPEFKVKSEKFKSLRKKQTVLHTMSRKGYARLEYEMRKENPNTSEISRVAIWTRGHLKKNGEPATESVSATMEKVKECSQSQPTQQNSIREDAIFRVFGPERRGRVRGLGFGATPSKVDAHMQSSGRAKHLEEKLQDVQSQLDELKALVLRQSQQPEQNSHTRDISDVNVTNARCQLLAWEASEKKIVAEGKVAATDPNVKVHHVLLGPSCWKVWVEEVFDRKAPLYRPTPEMSMLQEAIGSTTAWPIKHIKLLDVIGGHGST